MFGDPSWHLAAVEAELVEERATGLVRSGRALEDQLRRCTTLLERLEADPDDGALLAAYRAARAAFVEVQWAYCVQREALGLWEHSWVHRTCPTPPRR